MAIGDWLSSYHEQLSELFRVEKQRLPSYSTIRRTVLSIEYQDYAASLAKFFYICPEAGETIAMDGKVVRGSFMVEKDNPNCESHPAIMLVSAYLVERGLILKPYEVEKKTNDPQVFARIHQNFSTSSEWCLLLTRLILKKTC